ncbi:MAG TPA: 2-dehydropantoate 2-reductase [Pseudonocardiaceae bacterium]|jgi:2-dehydropantoate 2-reductase|nr:2-dehydropantoate 2-reductase [Pseudonocardiaceae bacterium]
MRILVVGAGATGGFFGARLAAAGRDVTFLVRLRRAALLRERGLRLVGLGEPAVLTPQLVTADTLTTSYDLVLLSVKATALDEAVKDLTPAVGPDTAIVPFLNGLAHLDVLTSTFGAERVLGGVVKVATTVDQNGDIRRLGRTAAVEIGELSGRPSARLDAAAELLSGAEFTFSVVRDVIAAMWHKWVHVSSVGALTCLMRGTVGDVVAVPGGPDLARAIVAEAAAVSSAAGHPVPAAALNFIVDRVTEAGSATTSSMYRDVVAGVPAEVEQVFGDLIARARDLSVATPLLDLATLNLRVHQHRVTG